MFQVDETIESLFLSQKSFFTEIQPDDTNYLDFQHFEKEDIQVRQNILTANGLHPVLDYMNLSLSSPVQYSP
jgi:hypothetical protein